MKKRKKILSLLLLCYFISTGLNAHTAKAYYHDCNKDGKSTLLVFLHSIKMI